MVDQAASRPQGGSAGATAPSMRVDLREETVTEKAQPGDSLPSLTLHLSHAAVIRVDSVGKSHCRRLAWCGPCSLIHLWLAAVLRVCWRADISSM